MEAQQFQIKNYAYDLPDNRIAKYPLAERDSSKLLVYQNGDIKEDIYINIDKYLSDEALLVFNNTKVIPARLHFRNATGGRIEIFCLEANERNDEPAKAMMQTKSVLWNCLIGRIEKWKEKSISIESEDITLKAEIVERHEITSTIKFSWQPDNLPFGDILEQLGEMPIPPYLKREGEEIDVSRYQTVYAQQQGSVAAPTAGLHFTQSIFEKLKAKNVVSDYVTLHVGAGTFKPVKSETMGGHIMHYEWIEIGIELIERIIHQCSEDHTNHNIVAVGTTSLRTIESLYWMGVKANNNLNSSIQELEIKQWDAYKLQQNMKPLDALSSLLAWFRKNKIEKLFCKTQLLIVPSYEIRIVNALITNFHQPSSTLLLIVAAVVGNDWRMIYNHALNNNFRFLSYGDGCLLFKKRQNKN